MNLYELHKEVTKDGNACLNSNTINLLIRIDSCREGPADVMHGVNVKQASCSLFLGCQQHFPVVTIKNLQVLPNVPLGGGDTQLRTTDREPLRALSGLFP